MKILAEAAEGNIKHNKDYDQYITQHIANVMAGYEWFEKNLPEVLDQIEDKKAFKKQLAAHDKSKYSEEEYQPYVDYFYGEKKTKAVKEAFNYAWNHHQHENPHHWQYWVLVNDDDGTIALEMPYNYIVEMILDWWTFSWLSGELSEVFHWYNDHKARMILGEKTKKTVEEILDKMKEKL